MLAFWEQHGGLGVLGYPRTDSFMEGGRLLQYTDHFLLQMGRDRVTVLPLGRVLTAQRHFPRASSPLPTATSLYFPSTGHRLSGRFLNWWQREQGGSLLGAPISEPVVEANGDGTGRRYAMQWFENGRLEIHPEARDKAYAMELGLTGIEALQRRGWLP